MATRPPRGFMYTAVAVALAAMGCGHQPTPSPAAPAAAAPVRDPQPGARPEERDHLLEAKWREVIVKAVKQGGEAGASVKLVEPKIRLFHAGPTPDVDGPGDTQPAKPKEGEAGRAIDLARELHKVTPLDVDHIDVLDGQVAFIDTSRSERPELWLHDLQLSVENLTTRLHLADGRPALLTASATVAHTGRLSIFITAEPFETGLTFSGRAALVGLATAELYRFIEPATKLQAPEGTIDIFIDFDCRNGALTGGIKPVLKNVKIRPTEKHPFAAIKAWAADLAVKIFSDRVPNRNAVATVIPIKGDLTAPNVELWPTIFGVLRNAFVEGLTSGYSHLPPPSGDHPPRPVSNAEPPSPEPVP